MKKYNIGDVARLDTAIEELDKINIDGTSAIMLIKKGRVTISDIQVNSNGKIVYNTHCGWSIPARYFSDYRKEKLERILYDGKD